MDNEADTPVADIRIVDLDLTKTSISRVHDQLRVMYLRLDREPDNDWRQLFFEERKSRIVARRRGFWIEDGYISFDTMPEEVETVHLPDIHRSMDYANREYRKAYRERAVRNSEAHASRLDERAEMLALQARVRSLVGHSEPDPNAGVETVAPYFGPAAPAVVRPEPPADEESTTMAEFEARRAELKQRISQAWLAWPKENTHGDD